MQTTGLEASDRMKIEQPRGSLGIQYNFDELIKSHLLPGCAMLLIFGWIALTIVMTLPRSDQDRAYNCVKDFGQSWIVFVIAIGLSIILGNALDIIRHTVFIWTPIHRTLSNTAWYLNCSRLRKTSPGQLAKWLTKIFRRWRAIKRITRGLTAVLRRPGPKPCCVRFGYYPLHEKGQLNTPRTVWSNCQEDSEKCERILASGPFKRAESLYYFGEMYGNFFLVFTAAIIWYVASFVGSFMGLCTPWFRLTTLGIGTGLLSFTVMIAIWWVFLLAYLDTMDDYLGLLVKLHLLQIRSPDVEQHVGISQWTLPFEEPRLSEPPAAS